MKDSRAILGAYQGPVWPRKVLGNLLMDGFKPDSARLREMHETTDFMAHVADDRKIGDVWVGVEFYDKYTGGYETAVYSVASYYGADLLRVYGHGKCPESIHVQCLESTFVIMRVAESFDFEQHEVRQIVTHGVPSPESIALEMPDNEDYHVALFDYEQKVCWI